MPHSRGIITSDRLPDVTRNDVGTILVSSQYVGSQDRQLALAGATESDWLHRPLPDGLVSLSCFLSGDGETVMVYGQWTDDEAQRTFADATNQPLTGGMDLREPVRYRLYRSATSDQDQQPGCVITATFDVDGPERQRHIADALLDASARIGALPGAISAHFHLSTDGSRVLNYAEWTDLAAHDAAVDSADLDEVYHLSTETPGVRPTRGRMYRLHAQLRGADDELPSR
jgi:quinol monooxygenase YgiN